MKKLISFWKQVREKSSDMFTLFRVGIGVKVPTHKLHVKDKTDPLKIEGLQNDTTDPDKYLSIDSSNVVKYRTGAQVLTDIGGTPLTTEEVQDIAGALVATGGTKTGIAVTYQDATGDVDFVIDHDAATNFVAAEHVDWAASGAGTIHTDNYIENVVQTTVTGSSGTVTSIGNLTGDVTSSNRATTIADGVVDTDQLADDAVTEGKLANALLAEIDANTAKATNVSTDLTYTTGSDRITIVSSDGINVVISEASGSIAGVMTVAHHDKLDSIEDSATADQTQADINGLAITTVGTIGTGTWSGTVIASNKLDADTAHLSGIQTFNGLKTFSNSIIYDGDRNATPGDGAAIHVDSSDITDNNTSASGTANAFNHVSIENPRIMATNASVTTTNASTVFIKGAPVASTNQTITNAWALHIAAGNVDISTVTAGTWNGTAIASAYIADDAITEDKLANSLLAEIDANTAKDTNVVQTTITGNAGTATNLTASTSTAVGLGTIELGHATDTTIARTAAGIVTIEGARIKTQELYVKILPSDFMPDDGGRPAMIDDTSGDRWLESHGTLKLFAFVEIPLGFKATECIIYGSATSAITVYEADVNSATVTSKGTGNIGTIIDGGDFTHVTADATNYIMIEMAQASGEKVYGGKMTIAAV
jgi:hypothetical protein